MSMTQADYDELVRLYVAGAKSVCKSSGGSLFALGNCDGKPVIIKTTLESMTVEFGKRVDILDTIAEYERAQEGK